MEEGADGDAVAVGPHALVVLVVRFFLIVTRIETAEAVEVAATVFSQGVCECKAEVAPPVVSGGDVGAGTY